MRFGYTFILTFMCFIFNLCNDKNVGFTKKRFFSPRHKYLLVFNFLWR